MRLQILDDMAMYYSNMQSMAEYIYQEEYSKPGILSMGSLRKEFGDKWANAFNAEIARISREYAFTSDRGVIKWLVSTGYFKTKAKKTSADLFWARVERSLLILTALLAFASVLLSILLR